MIETYPDYRSLYVKVWWPSKAILFRSWLDWKNSEIQKKRLEKLAKLKLSRIIYILIEYILLIRNYRRAKGWRLTEEE